MTLRSQVAKHSARLVQILLKKLTKGGSSLPGKIAKKLDPAILAELGKNYRVVIITGTNGKSVTTALTVNILRQKFDEVLTNDTGSNLEQGIISTFLNANSKGQGDNIAVLEVDEASVRHITEYINPEVILVTNLFRDQLDRFGEIYTTFDYILEGANKSPKSLLLMNGDAPIFASRDFHHNVAYFGFSNSDKTTDKMAHYNTDGVLCPRCEHILHYHMITYSNLGDYFCPNCQFHRPSLTYSVDQVDKLTPETSTFTIGGQSFTIPVAGIYNIYNALAAYSIARYLGLSQTAIHEGLQGAKRMFGRQEALTIHGKDTRINLIKNPVGFNQIVSLLELDQEEFSLLVLLNDNPADGQDISWIWDAMFENIAQLPNIKATAVGGIRVKDLKVRMQVAGFDEDRLKELSNSQEALQWIASVPSQKVYVLATYTAMLDFRRELADQHLVKERMKS